MAGICGCFEPCSCMLSVAPPELLSLSGDGDPLSGGWLITALETLFSATNADGGIVITPGGPYGHTPNFDLKLDPASPAPLSVSGAGLSVACCPGGGGEATTVSDTGTVDLNIAGVDITADVIMDTSRAIDNLGFGVAVKIQDDDSTIVAVQPENRIHFNVNGEIVTEQDGAQIAELADGGITSVPVTAGVENTASLTTFTNTGTTDIVLRFSVGQFLQLTSLGATALSYSYDFLMRLTPTVLLGGAIVYPSAASTSRGVVVSEVSLPVVGSAPGGAFVSLLKDEVLLYLPAGASAVIKASIHCRRTLAVGGWATTVVGGSYYQTMARTVETWPARIDGPRPISVIG